MPISTIFDSFGHDQGNASALRAHHRVIKFVALFRLDVGMFASRCVMVHLRAL
jgi:hypothetical protein